MKKLVYSLIILGVLISACKKEEEDNAGHDGYSLVWSDEFDSQIDPANWSYELGDGTAYGKKAGWGNNELQLYTSSSNNSLVQADEDGNSVLAITAKKEAGDNQYSSAKLTTQTLQSFRFGRIEARIKVPSGKGLWPAFWLLGDNASELDWPGCGEIDIMEVIGHDPGVVHSSVHYTNGENRWGTNTEDLDMGVNLSEDYHIYRMDWTTESMSFYIDDQFIQETLIEEDMKEFLRSFYIIFNVAVGGNWPGDPDETTIFPQKMYIDWVRYYSKDGLNIPDEPSLDIAEETIGTLSGELAKYAFNESVEQFPGLSVKTYGGEDGEPYLSTSDMLIDGDSSILVSYPGGNWGGVYFLLEPAIDANDFASTTLKFSINAPESLYDAEIKLESLSSNVSLYLVNYEGVDVGNGFKEYSIPMADFADLTLDDFSIPFAIWNPKDANDEYWVGELLLDNVYFE